MSVLLPVVLREADYAFDLESVDLAKKQTASAARQAKTQAAGT
jgi:hypothetical protein